MAKSIRNIVNQLINEGFDVTYYVRKDGGILIRSINGQKFTGAQGNIVAREMVGETLSERRSTQLKSAMSKRKAFAEEFGKKAYNKYKKVASKWKKAKLPESAGKISMKKVRRIAKTKGIEEALRYLSEKEKYASGIAYSKNVEILAYYIQDLGNKLSVKFGGIANEYFNLASDLISNEDKIREQDIPEAYKELYRLVVEPLTESLITEVVRNTRTILGL